MLRKNMGLAGMAKIHYVTMIKEIKNQVRVFR